MGLHPGTLAGTAGNTRPDAGSVPLSAYVGLTGLTCWALVRRVLLEQCGIERPHYGEIYAHELLAVARTIAVERAQEVWLRVAEPQAFDVALLFSRDGARRAMSHIGIMVDCERVLHIDRDAPSVIVPLSHWSVRHRLAGFYRFVG